MGGRCSYLNPVPSRFSIIFSPCTFLLLCLLHFYPVLVRLSYHVHIPVIFMYMFFPGSLPLHLCLLLPLFPSLLFPESAVLSTTLVPPLPSFPFYSTFHHFLFLSPFVPLLPIFSTIIQSPSFIHKPIFPDLFSSLSLRHRPLLFSFSPVLFPRPVASPHSPRPSVLNLVYHDLPRRGTTNDVQTGGGCMDAVGRL